MDLCKSIGIFFLPVVDEEKKIVSILNLKNYKSFIALDAVLMAGGKAKDYTRLPKKFQSRF